MYLASGTNGRYGVYGPMGDAYSSSAATFGDGLDYSAANGAASTNGATAAVDVMHGLDLACTFYLRLFGRDHFDGSNGYFVPVYVHKPGLDAPAKAHWSPNWPYAEDYWMEFRDHTFAGTGSPTELSVVAHEWTHLINYRAARVGRDGGDGMEQKAVNEASSTILGAAVALWRATGAGWGIGTPNPPDWKRDWSYQPQVMAYDPGHSSVPGIQVLYRPSYVDRWEPSWWTQAKSGWAYDPHTWGAPLHRAFYF